MISITRYTSFSLHPSSTNAMEQCPSWEAKISSASQKKRHLSLSWARIMQSIFCHPTFLSYILILFFHLHLCLPSGLFPSCLLTKPHNHFSSLTCLPYPAHLVLVATFPYMLYYPICFPLINWSFHQVPLSIYPYIILHKYKVPSAGW